MCGIIGYTGSGDALNVLIEGLNNLEYRGYDSAGIALGGPSIEWYKKEGEVSALETLIETEVQTGATDGGSNSASTGVGHTRWSTHGPPSDENAHPHTSCDGEVAVVHNGIIENHEELRERLRRDGHVFHSETDTEVIPHLIETYLASGADPSYAFRRAVDALKGSYAIAAVFEGENAVYGTRRDSPLVVGLGSESNYLASDVPAFITHTDRVIYLEDEQFVRLGPERVVVTDGDGTALDPSIETIEWSPEDAGKGGFDHYMLKEIHEQPNAIRNCLRGRVEELTDSIHLEELADVEVGDRVHIVGCGTSYHAAMYGSRVFREYGTTTHPYLASEYDAESVPIDTDTLVLAITQSGETADTLSAIREANRAGASTVAVTNVVGSSASRECDHTTYIRAGPEVGVAATKTFTSQQIALSLVASELFEDGSSALASALRDLPDAIQTVLDTSGARTVASELLDADAYFFVGRRYHHSVAREGALKLKEISYKHAEGFAAGELKHGPLALVTERTPVIAFVTGNGESATKTLGNVTEVDARGAPIVAVTDSREAVDRYADYVLEIPETHPRFAPVLANVQAQLLAYWIANGLDRSIDKPRNLAKSVTVE